MTDKEKIRAEIERLLNEPAPSHDSQCNWEDGYWCALYKIEEFIDSLQEEPVSEDLKNAADNALESISDQYDIISVGSCLEMFRLGSDWSKKHLWKDAQGDDLPTIDRKVIALLNNGKVVFAHRPYKGKYIGKSLTTGNIETLENQTFDEGGWNYPDVKYWLDCEIPKEMEE